MKFSYNWLKELTGIKESPEELAELLTLRVFEVESVEKKGTDWALDIKLFPNRVADASGHLGLAREIAMLKNYKFQIANFKQIQNPKLKIQKTISVKIKIEDPQDCWRYTALKMEGVRIGETPAWVKERLQTCGVQSINNIVDAANYVMLETGQPLHVFDYDKVRSSEVRLRSLTKSDFEIGIFIRRAKKNEQIQTLDEKIYELNPEILVIADSEKPLAIAGIKGGKESGVSGNTSSILLEAANFNPLRIRIGSRGLNLTTDASYRFERGLDPNQTEIAIRRLADIIQKVAGGKVSGGMVDKYSKKIIPKKIILRNDYANQRLGKEFSASFYQKFFKRIGWKVIKKIGNNFFVSPPSNRLDLEIEEDLIEEIARLTGFENFPSLFPPQYALQPNDSDEQKWKEFIQNYLISQGFTEHLPYEFGGAAEFERFGIDLNSAIELENPASSETKYLVPRVLIKYLTVASENLRKESNLRFFGIAKSFPKTEKERQDLLIVFAGKEKTVGDLFYQVKGILEQLLETMGIAEHEYLEEKNDPIFHLGRSAVVKIGAETLGKIGEIKSNVLRAIKTPGLIAATEINFDLLWQTAREEGEYRPIPKFPAIIRDIAIILPQETRTSEVLNLINQTAGPLLIDIDLFDYFEDQNLRRKNSKSLAFHLIFQSAERTLKDQEIDSVMKKIGTALKKENWKIRE